MIEGQYKNEINTLISSIGMYNQIHNDTTVISRILLINYLGIAQDYTLKIIISVMIIIVMKMIIKFKKHISFHTHKFQQTNNLN